MRRIRGMTVLPAIAALLCLAPTMALAQIDPALDHVGMYFDTPATQYCVSTETAYQVVRAYLILTRPSELGALGGWECSIEIRGNPLGVAWTLMGNALNIDTPPQFQVGLINPVPSAPAVPLVAVDLIVAAPADPIRFYVHAYRNPSLPAWPGPIYALAADPGVLVPLYRSTGSDSVPVAVVNAPCPPITTVPGGLYVDISGNAGAYISRGARAATRLLATDDYDPGLDRPLASGPSGYVDIYFPHPVWPGARFQVDTRAIFDPAVEAKTWTFEVATDVPGPVNLDFAPSLTPSLFAGLRLRDNYTGEIVDLYTSPRYTYSQSGSVRSFDLMIGPQASTGFSVGITAAAGGYMDRGHMAAAQPGATDGFDVALDMPEPGPPPTNYVCAWFAHPDWPYGYRYRTDVRAMFDPTTEQKSWELGVQTDRVGQVQLTFAPTFSRADGVGLLLRDRTTGALVDLFASLSYAYTQSVPGLRTFDVLIGPGAAVPALQPAQRALPAAWSMVGTPLLPLESAGTLQDVILGDAPAWSYLFRYGGSAYESVPGSAPAVQGEGLWIVAPSPFTWTMDGVRDLDGTAVALRRGWTLVGYPLWFTGPLAGLRVDQGGTRYDFATAVAAGLISPSLYTYDSMLAAYATADSLRAWHGYWVAGLQEGVSLWFDYPNFAMVAKSGAAGASAAGGRSTAVPATSDGWRTRLILSSGGRTARAEFGVQTGATEGFDSALEAPEPPPAPEDHGPGLAFLHPEWRAPTGDRFLGDVRAPLEGRPVSWDVRVSLPDPGPAVLSWDVAAWPEGLDLEVYLPAQNRVVVPSMRQRSSVDLDVGAGPLTVSFRTPDDLTGIPEQGLRTLLEARPNPFNPTTVIRWQVPSGARDVALGIYDERGRLVRVLASDSPPGGWRQQTWDGRDDHGRQLGSGIYFARLRVDGEVKIQKLTLVR